MEEAQWKKFRTILDKSDRKLFDRIFAFSRLYNSACSNSAKPTVIHPILISILFDQYRQLMTIQKERQQNIALRTTNSN